MVELAYFIKKLSKPAHDAFFNARKSAELRGNSLMELAHWLEQMALTVNSDFDCAVRYFGLNSDKLAKDMTAAVDRFPQGASSVSAVSEHIDTALDTAWRACEVTFGDRTIRSGHILLACLQDRTLRQIIDGISPSFKTIDPKRLKEDFYEISKASIESGNEDQKHEDEPGAHPDDSQKSALESFAVNLTERAESGAMDPIVGRDDEIRQLIDVLMRRRQNNPILVGEAGVGKTAVVEGFAQRLVQGDVPPMLKNVALWSLDVGLLQAGASMKGEFEERLRKVIEEVQNSEIPIILFIDEAHTLVGAGGAAGTGDAANLLKPALARGELRTVAATTWAEYKRHIEKDPALSRRFEAVQVGEPDHAKAVTMMRGLASNLEAHHDVMILDEALDAAVALSMRYVPARQLPDKAVAILDTACARIAVSQHGVPAKVEALRRRISAYEIEQRIAKREAAIGLDRADRIDDLAKAKSGAATRLAEAEAQWESEKAIVAEIIDLRRRLSGEVNEEKPNLVRSGAEEDKLRHSLSEKRDLLAELQGEDPMVLALVDRSAVGSVVQDWTGVPVSRMSSDEIETILTLPAKLSERVVGQDYSLELISKRIEVSRAGLSQPEKPVGVFLLAGPSGVGKTETAIALAELLYGGEQNLITINMSEFQESHTVSTLKGAPPGYVGYGEGGVLTEAVRRKPYSVVLLDEVEKAHSDVHEIFFQVFDKGRMEDGEGRAIDFKNCIILLTSNIGSSTIMDLCIDKPILPDAEELARCLRPELLEVFPAALLGRLSVIPYYPLKDDTIDTISRLKLGSLQKRMKDTHGAELTYDDDVLALIRERCTELESGGRMIDAVLTNMIMPKVGREALQHLGQGTPVPNFVIRVENGNFSVLPI